MFKKIFRIYINETKISLYAMVCCFDDFFLCQGYATSSFDTNLSSCCCLNCIILSICLNIQDLKKILKSSELCFKKYEKFKYDFR